MELNKHIIGKYEALNKGASAVMMRATIRSFLCEKLVASFAELFDWSTK